MANESDPLRDLAALLSQAGTRATLVRERIAPSTLYDAQYHLAVISCAFKAQAAGGVDGVRRIVAGWLKLLQFVAARPRLAKDLLEWIGSKRDPNLENWLKMPRGYMGDRTHDSVVEYLVASGVFMRDREDLLGGPQVCVLDRLAEQIEAAGLFGTEREVIGSLGGVKVTRAMLEGR